MFDMNVQMREIARITFATVTLALPEKDVKLDVSKFFLARSGAAPFYLWKLVQFLRVRSQTTFTRRGGSKNVNFCKVETDNDGGKVIKNLLT